MLNKTAWVLLLLPLAACASGPPPPFVRLPPDVMPVAADPMRSAILGTAYTFNATSTPAATLRAAGLVEFLAAETRWDVRWTEYAGTIAPALDAARQEIRTTFGIAPGASPQAAADMLFAASRALDRGNPIYLPSEVFPDPALAEARLTAPPALPITRVTVAMVEGELHRIDGMRNSGGLGSGGGGGGGGGGAQL